MDVSELLKSEEVQRYLRTATTTVGTTVYNEIYLYVWFICIYNIFLLAVIIINLYLLIKLVNNSSAMTCGKMCVHLRE